MNKRGQKNSRQKGDGLHLGEGPFYFSGEPSGCRGKIVFVNNSKEWVRINQLELSGFDLKTPAGTLLDSVTFNGHLKPGEITAIAMKLPLHPATTGGEYQGEVHLEEQREPMFIHVVETKDFEFSPTRITVCGEPGQEINTILTIKNNGNTACVLPSSLVLPIADDDNLEVSAVQALQEAGQGGWEPVRDKFIQILADLQFEPIRVIIRTKGQILPGTTAQASLALTIPQSAAPNHTLRGKLNLLDKKLKVDLQVVQPPVK